MIYEDGYTVTTVFDGNKLNINPHSIASYKGSHDLFLLDSSNSVFYTLSLPLSQGNCLFHVFFFFLLIQFVGIFVVKLWVFLIIFLGSIINIKGESGIFPHYLW